MKLLAGSPYRQYIKRLPGAIRLYQRLRDTWLFIARKHWARGYVVSYPKSGRTWLRVLLAKYFSLYFNCALDVDFEQILGRKSAPLLVFTHAGAASSIEDVLMAFYRRKIWLKEGKKLVLIFRDPRDVIVSLYYQERFREQSYHGDISSFLRHPRFGISLLIEYMNLWGLAANEPTTFVVYYEDMHRDTYKILSELLAFMNIEVVPDFVQQSVDFARFENMRRLEQRGVIKSFRLRAVDPTNPDTYKTRKGKVGSYREELAAEDILYLESYINSRLASLFGRYKYCTFL